MSPFKRRIKSIIEDNSTTEGKLFDLLIIGLICISIVSFSFETIPTLDSGVKNILFLIDNICMAIFVMEYLLRIWVSDQKLRYIFSFYGLVDLLAILPFILPTHLDLRILRAMRFFRLTRALKLVRYSKALQRLLRALYQVKEELVLFVVLTIILIYFAAVAIYYFEHEAQPEKFGSVFDALWWAVATLTTVGYGDVYPITIGGKVFTFIILIIGLGIIAMPAGLISSALTDVRHEDEKQQQARAHRGRS